MSLETDERRNSKVAPLREMRCPRCSAAVKPGKKFCSQCGCPAGSHMVGTPIIRPLPKTGRSNICPECSFENHHSDRFCKGCGGLLATSLTNIASHDWSGRALSGMKSTVTPHIEPGPDLDSGAPQSSLQAAASGTVAGPGTIFMPPVDLEPDAKIGGPGPSLRQPPPEADEAVLRLRAVASRTVAHGGAEFAPGEVSEWT